jgi:hypothetical protein
VPEICDFCEYDIVRSVVFKMGQWDVQEQTWLDLGDDVSALCSLPLPPELWVDGIAQPCEECEKYPAFGMRYRLLVIDGVVAEARPWVDLDVHVHEWTELSIMDGTGLVPLKDGTLSLFIEGGDDPMGAVREAAQRLFLSWATWYDGVLTCAADLAGVEKVDGRSLWEGSDRVEKTPAYKDFSAVADVLRPFDFAGGVEAIYLDSFYSLQFASLPDALDALQQVNSSETYIGPEDKENRDWVFCITTRNEIVGFGVPAIEFIEGIVNE